MSITVVMPAYNEEGAIEGAVREVKEGVLDRVPGSFLCVVNDGSKDRTREILDRLSAADPRVKGIHQPNGGHGAALITGMDAATTDWILLIDSDRQIPLDSFPLAWAKAQEGDGAFGIRVSRKDAPTRIVLTKIIRFVLFLMFFRWIRDANVPYKIIRRSLWKEASRIIPRGTLAPSLFLAIYARVKGFRIAEVPVEHKDRETGEVSIKKWKLVKFCGRAFRQLLRFRMAL